jgi:uncharacterized RDD family membrane protein YckC
VTGLQELHTPGIARRLASMVYESLLLFAIAFAAAWLFFFGSGGAPVQGATRTILQAFLVTVFAAYFLWCWLRGGQTLAMKAWRIRLIGPGGTRPDPARALARFLLAAVAVPTGIGVLWAIFDGDRQFLHDRIAGTRLVSVDPPNEGRGKS